MKSATLPALRVSPDLKQAAENALRPNETISKLMQASLERFIAHRAAEDEFIARGLRSAEEARQSQVYFSADEVLQELKSKLTKAKSSAS
ncbi:MAG: prevent-host-death protein [Pseudomonadota bacterium]|jgi:predicted transcriptional regulator